MDREIKNKNILDKFCMEFSIIVGKHTKYIIVSGFVAIASGRTRGTEDIDMILEEVSKEKFILIHDDLVKNGFVCMQSSDGDTIYYEYLAKKASVRYTYGDKPLPEMEIKFAKDYLDVYQIKNRVKLPLTGLDVWFSSIDSNIAFKEEYLKSDKDLEDAKHLRIVYAKEIDETEINKIKGMIRKLRL